MKSYQEYSDNQLVHLLQGDDDKAFTEIYNRYWKLLYYIAYKRLGNYEEAEECVQDVFADIWGRRKTLQITRLLKYYLAAAVQYQVMKQLSQRSRNNLQALDEEATTAMTSAAADQQLLFGELEVQIQELVGTLPEKCRLVYTLSRHDGLNNKAIASQLGISEKTVENQLTKALSRIRNGLGFTAYLYARWRIMLNVG